MGEQKALAKQTFLCYAPVISHRFLLGQDSQRLRPVNVSVGDLQLEWQLRWNVTFITTAANISCAATC